MRCIHELSSWPGGLFITLTYNEESLKAKGDNNLSLVHLQKFIKRIRYTLSKIDRKIKHFSCGEYGDEDGRPHYHLIIFGLTIKDCVKTSVGWQCPMILEEWPYGFHNIGTVTYESCKYVAKYIVKEPTGFFSDLAYPDCVKPFHIRSQGIGKGFVQKNWFDIVSKDGVSFNGKLYGIPKYYLKVLNDVYNEIFDIDLGEGKGYNAWWADRKELLEDIRDGRDVTRMEQREKNAKSKYDLANKVKEFRNV